ncbi:MAG: GlmU family protein [Bacteroidota bacterium]|nr:GlmU family protein [Bacteroidota bacterium]
MAEHICIFEDAYYARLFPLVYFRPVYNLKCGIVSLKEKILRTYTGVLSAIHCRPYLSDYMRLRNPGVHVNEVSAESCLFINGRIIADEHLAKKIPLKGQHDTVYVKGGQIVAARVSGAKLIALKNKMNDVYTLSDFNDLRREEVDVTLVNYPWDVISHNSEELRRDFKILTKRKTKKMFRGNMYPGSHLLNRKEIFVDEGTVIKPGCTLDAEAGPIYIGKHVTIMPHSTIIGPAFIGDGSILKVGARIYEDTSIGPVCKVGGEVEASIFHGYSNKQHDGFIGHSYIGTWVNLGADTNNSDLKNNYGPVKVYINGDLVDSGSQFVGLTIGDHSKSAINSMFNTGTVVGVSSNIFGYGFPPKYVPSFSWGAAGETFTTYNVDRAIDVARRVMLRRKMSLTDVEEKLFRKIFELTMEERKKRGMPA